MTTRKQFGVQRKTTAELAYFRARDGRDFVPILQYNPLTAAQKTLLNKVYYADGHMVGYAKLFEAVRKESVRNHPPQGLKADGSKWYPSRTQVQAWLDTQELVQRYKPIQNQKIHQPIRVKSLLERLQLDILNMSNANMYNGYKYILNAIDIYSKKGWSQLIKTQNDGINNTAPTALKTRNAFYSILDRIYREHNEYPKRFQTDGGSEFLGVFKQAFQPGGHWVTSGTAANPHPPITSNFSIAYRATSQSVVERWNRTMRSIIAKFIKLRNEAGNDIQPWPTKLQTFVDNYNNSKHKTLKMSPNEMFDPNNRNRIKQIKDDMNTKILDRNKNFLTLKDDQKVRLKDYKEAKSEMNKDKPKWSKIIYVVDGHRLNRSTGIREYYIHDPITNRDPRTSLKANIGIGRHKDSVKSGRRRFGIYDLLPINNDTTVSTRQAAIDAGIADADSDDADADDVSGGEESDDDEATNPQNIVGKRLYITWYKDGDTWSPWTDEPRNSIGRIYSYWAKVNSYNARSKLHEVKYEEDGKVMKHNFVHKVAPTANRAKVHWRYKK